MGTHSQTQSVLSNIIIVSNQMLVVLVNYWCPKGQMSIWQFLRRNWVPWWLSSKESACDARAAVDTDPMDCSPPDPSVHGTSQARILEGVAMSSSRGFPRHVDWTQVSCIAGTFFTNWATRETINYSTINWRRKWQPTPVFLSGESHGQRSPAGYHHQ